MAVLLDSAYWPNLYYFYYILNSDKVVIESMEFYQKQSYRNRCTILSANGALDLRIPIKHNGKQLMRDVMIDYRERWQAVHWGAITSAYKNSPFFDYFEDEISSFYTTQFTSLLEYNLVQLKCVLQILRTKKEIELTEDYHAVTELLDKRGRVHPKKEVLQEEEVDLVLNKEYYQTFNNKFPFTPNLSILDLLFNTGMQTLDYFQIGK
jgi:hypothetical protein